MVNKILLETAEKAKPLVDALAAGKQIEFRHNDEQWRDYRGCNLIEVCMSPNRYRIKSK